MATSGQTLSQCLLIKSKVKMVLPWSLVPFTVGRTLSKGSAVYDEGKCTINIGT